MQLQPIPAQPGSQSQPKPATKKPIVQPPCVLLMGGTGTGKTFSLSTLVDAGLKIVALITEPTGLDSLLDAFERRKLPIENLFWKQITPARPGISSMIEMAEKVAIMDQESLSKLKPGPGRQNSNWLTLLKAIQRFEDERTGTVLGDLTELGPDYAVVIDSLSGLSIMAWDAVVGTKPTASPGEWAIAMSQVEKLLLQLTSDTKSTFILTAHVERELDEISGANRIMVSTLGKKLAPKLPRFFSEVVMTVKDGNDFFWSTTFNNVDLKNRALPLSSKLDPSFKPIIDAYRRRVAQVTPKA